MMAVRILQIISLIMYYLYNVLLLEALKRDEYNVASISSGFISSHSVLIVFGIRINSVKFVELWNPHLVFL